MNIMFHLFAAAIAIYLAFIPPERYIRFIRSHA